MNSVHLKIAERLQGSIEELNLDGVKQVLLLTLADDERPELKGSDALPAVVLCPVGTETVEKEWNAADDVGYPVLWLLLEPADRVQTAAELDRRLLLREIVFDTYSRNRLTTSDGKTFNTKIEPAPIIDAQAWFNRELFVSALTIRCTHRRVRRRGNG